MKSNEEGLNFYLLRNPSCNNKSINPELIQLDSASNTFWIQSEQIYFVFTRIIMTHVEEWEELRVKGAF
jgi:hypothetical protein